MTKKSTLILACVATTITMSAKQVTADEALARYKAAGGTPAAAKATVAPVAVKTIYTADNAEALYLYRSGDTMLVLPADDRVAPLLGYYDAPAAAGDLMPRQLTLWLDGYARQIAYVMSLPEGRYKAAKSAEGLEPIEPLVSTKWGQGSPFNRLCPTINGEPCYTGCVATAGAQAMSHFKYPAKATGSITYTDRYSGEERWMNFDERDLDWDNMLDSYSDGYTDTQADAVAYLMKACGFAAKSAYTANGTETWESVMLKTLIGNFGYSDKGRFLVRDNYNTDTWENIIYQNLKTVGPVIYGGDDTFTGHCFVCDGYDGQGFFHINWGWSGYADGYFRLSALNPYGTDSHGAAGGISFSLNQDALVNLAPSGRDVIDLPDESPLTWRGNLTATLSASNTITLSHDNGDFYDSALSNLSPLYTDYELCLAAYNPETKTTTILDKAPITLSINIYGDDDVVIDGLRLDYGTSTGLAEGTYTCYPVARVAGTSQWKEPQHPVYAANYFFAKIDDQGNIVTVDSGTGEFPDIDELKLETPLYMGKKFIYSYDLTSYSDNNLIAAYMPELYIVDDTTGALVKIAEGEVATTYMNPDDDLHLTFTSDMYIDDDYAGYTGPALFTLSSRLNGQTIGSYVETSVDELPSGNVNLKSDGFTASQDQDDPENLTFNFSATSQSGYYFDKLYVYIEDQDENYVDLATSDREYCFAAGSSATGSISHHFTNYTPGEKYNAYLCYYDDNAFCWFDMTDFTMPDGAGLAAVKDGGKVTIATDRADGGIIVTAPTAIAKVEGFAPDGRAVDLGCRIGATSARAKLPKGLTIVRVTLTDGSVTTAKVAR